VRIGKEVLQHALSTLRHVARRPTSALRLIVDVFADTVAAIVAA